MKTKTRNNLKQKPNGLLSYESHHFWVISYGNSKSKQPLNILIHHPYNYLSNTAITLTTPQAQVLKDLNGRSVDWSKEKRAVKKSAFLKVICHRITLERSCIGKLLNPISSSHNQLGEKKYIFLMRWVKSNSPCI